MSRPPGDERNLAPSENYLLGHRKRINDCLRGLSDFLRCGDRHSECWRRVKTRLACGCGLNEAAERVSGRRFALCEHVGWIKERPRKLLFPLTSHLCHYTPVTGGPEKGFFFCFRYKIKAKGHSKTAQYGRSPAERAEKKKKTTCWQMSIHFIVNDSKAGAATARRRFEGLTAKAKNRGKPRPPHFA